MNLALIILLAVTVEGLVEYGKEIAQKDMPWEQIAAIVVAVFLAVVAGADLYALLGVSFMVPYVGMVLTGIFLSRGANYIADFASKLQGPQREVG